MNVSATSSVLAPLWLGLALSIPAFAQTPAPKPEDAKPEDREILERRHDRERSWSLFRACDPNADDRLDVFEFAIAFRIRKDRAKAFSRIDTSRNGEIDWPEFDAYFRAEVARLSEFRVYPPVEPRPLNNPASPQLKISAGLLLIRNNDGNRDRRLDPREFGAFLLATKVPGLYEGLKDQFSVFDKNSNGFLELEEFDPIAKQVPGVEEMIRGTKDPRSSLPDDDKAADQDLDGVLSESELRSGLQSIHPYLGRIADIVLQRANRNLDRPARLGGSELVAARRSARAWLEAKALELKDD